LNYDRKGDVMERLNKKADELTEKMMGFFTGFLCNTYRQTFKEGQISDELVKFARERGLPVSQGTVKKNVVIYKAGTGKYKDVTFPVILQSHMDMVCVSSKPDIDKENVFAKGVQPYYEDNNTKMRGRSAVMPEVLTSLGADDGIGVAATCAILDDRELEHPPIVAVITVEEEDGMDGARVLTREDITGLAPSLDWNNAKLINIDDERDGIFSVSCAGTLRGTVVLPI
jgi:dipeptidase D